MTQIFLSYRRADSDVIVGRIRDRLAQAYGNKSIFVDIDNIPFGVDFRSHVKEILLRGDLMVAVIGPNWIGRDEHGRSRLDDDTDPVRLELEAALERKLPIIPVLVHGATMPKASDLPPSLRDFAFYNAANVDSGRDFHPHLDRLINSIRPRLKKRPRQRLWLWAALGALCLTVVAGGAWLYRHAGHPSGSSPGNNANSPKLTAQADGWRLLRSLPISELRSTLGTMRSEGFELRNINGYVLNGVERYATLWLRQSSPNERSGWDWDSAAYQNRQDELIAKGLRPVFISAYAGSRGVRYADRWTKAQSKDWLVHRQLSADNLNTAIIELAKRRLHPVHIYGLAANGTSQFIVIFEPQQGEANVVSIDTPASENTKEWDRHLKQGYRPRTITGYRIGNADYLTTLWEKGPLFASQFGITENNLNSIIKQRTDQGLTLTYLNVYAGLGGLRHNLIWEKP